MTASNRAVPQGYHTLTPYFRVRDAARAIEFYRAAFGAEELLRMAGRGGRGIMHAEIRIGDSPVMLGEEMKEWNALSPQSLGGTGSGIHIYVADVDAAVARAAAAGATVTMQTADMFWGDRYAKLTDPFGHEWSIGTRKEDLTPEQMAERAAAFFGQMKQ